MPTLEQTTELDEIIQEIEKGIETNPMYFHKNENDVAWRLRDTLRATGYYKELNLDQVWINCRCINEGGLCQWLKHISALIKMYDYHRGN